MGGIVPGRARRTPLVRTAVRYVFGPMTPFACLGSWRLCAVLAVVLVSSAAERSHAQSTSRQYFGSSGDSVAAQIRVGDRPGTGFLEFVSIGTVDAEYSGIQQYAVRPRTGSDSLDPRWSVTLRDEKRRNSVGQMLVVEKRSSDVIILTMPAGMRGVPPTMTLFANFCDTSRTALLTSSGDTIGVWQGWSVPTAAFAGRCPALGDSMRVYGERFNAWIDERCGLRSRKWSEIPAAYAPHSDDIAAVFASIMVLQEVPNVLLVLTMGLVKPKGAEPELLHEASYLWISGDTVRRLQTCHLYRGDTNAIRDSLIVAAIERGRSEDGKIVSRLSVAQMRARLQLDVWRPTMRGMLFSLEPATPKAHAPEVLVPYERIAHLINPSGPLAGFVVRASRHGGR